MSVESRIFVAEFILNAPFLLQNEPFEQPQTLGIEFIAEGKSFWYAIEILDGILTTEELYETNFGKSEPELIFDRSLGKDGKTKTHFNKTLNIKTQSLLELLVNRNITLKDSIISYLLSLHRENINIVYTWFKNLEIITPSKKAENLVYLLAQDKELLKYPYHILIELVESQNTQEILSQKHLLHLE